MISEAWFYLNRHLAIDRRLLMTHVVLLKLPIYFHMLSGNQTKVITCWKTLAWELHNVRAFAVFDKFVQFFPYYLLSLLVLTSSVFGCLKAKPKLKSAIGVDWITVCQVSSACWYLSPDFMLEHGLQNCRQRMSWK